MSTQPKKKHIAFVSLFGLTELYESISRHLPTDRYHVHWITTNEYWTEYLKANGVPRDDILQLIYGPDDFLDSQAGESVREEIARCESRSDLSVNQVLLMDRFLAGRPRPEINEYVYLYYRNIKRFLQEKQIECVFAEPTNANDLITYMICRELGIGFVSPRDMRYPPRRLVFFDGYQQSRIIPRREGAADPSGKDLIETFAERRPTPYYFDRLNHRGVVYPGKIAGSVIRRLRLKKIVSGRSLTHYDAWGRVKLTTRRAVNSFYMRRICRYTDFHSLTGKFAFFGLHVQPENSIDVLGSYVSDQLKLIKDIRRALPFDITLVVKEHPNFIGLKSIRFFREVQKLPNVKLIRHDISTFDIYRRANLVLTVSGTAAYEAGLLGVPAITFSPMFFSGLSSVYECTDPSMLKGRAQPLLNGFERDFESDCAFMKSLVQNSYEAYWTDPAFDRAVLDPQNIQNLATAFDRLLSDDSR